MQQQTSSDDGQARTAEAVGGHGAVPLHRRLAGDDVWREVARLFGNRHGMRPKRRWLFGYSSRIGADRIDLLCSTPAARRLCELVEPLDRAAFAALLTRSLVNLEQARAGFRVSLVGNITVPLGALAIYNQIEPGAVARWLGGGPLEDRVLVAAVFGGTALLILAGMFWAHAGLSAARDLNHLLHLIGAARRDGAAGGSAPAAEDEEALLAPGS